MVWLNHLYRSLKASKSHIHCIAEISALKFVPPFHLVSEMVSGMELCDLDTRYLQNNFLIYCYKY